MGVLKVLPRPVKIPTSKCRFSDLAMGELFRIEIGVNMKFRYDPISPNAVDLASGAEFYCPQEKEVTRLQGEMVYWEDAR